MAKKERNKAELDVQNKAFSFMAASNLKLMHNNHMRTTISLDDDVHEFATYYANARGITLSAAMNELIRKAESAPAPPVQIEYSPNGLPRFPRTGRVLTSEMVKAAQEDDLEQ